MILEHVNLTVADLDRSIDFYSKLLGWTVRWSGTTSGGRKAAHLGDDRFYLALFQAESGKTDPPAVDYERTGFNHFGLVVDDLDTLRDRLAELDTSVKAEADYEPGRRLYFLDPDGIEVELVEYDAA